ncbi:hypothetical protein [Ewingella americana]|uniref:hypothetical protein n=1 Tax=Ewingella americana TaxID=41202 RepID=UPI0012ADBBDA|nr:hypothetical protein [Ewingella americana]MRT05907.1 hypothetical protein [Ewingella americana]
MTTSESIAEKLNNSFKELGFTPKKAYYDNTAFLLGWKISNQAFELVYRPEGNTLLICSLLAKQPRAGLSTILLPVLRLWETIKPSISEIHCLKAMIGRTGGPEACELRQKMVVFLQDQGASVYVDDNDQWIEIKR